MTISTGRVARASQMLADNTAVQAAFMAWLETVITRKDRVYRITSGLEHNEDSRLSHTVWTDHDLVGVALATQVFKGGEWLLTTYRIDGEGAP